MGVQRRKISVQELEIGMFVADLDRPWHETPFPIQGFYIRNQKEVDELTRHCRHVQVDVAEKRESAAAESTGAAARRDGNNGKVIKLPAVKVRNPHHYETTRPLRKEVRDVQPVLDNVEKALDRVGEALAEGRSRIDVDEVSAVARTMAESVARNPDALLWLSRVQSRDDYTYRHSLNISIWALLLGRQLGLDPDVLHKLSLGALLSHIGKARLPESMQVPENELTGEQWQTYCRYPETGARIAAESDLPRVVVNVIRYHRERHNGTGFPQRVNGEHIPLLAKLVGLVDYYESLIEPRDRRSQLTPAQAVSRLFECRNSQFQEDLVEQFIQAIGVYPTGTIVELATREIGVVVSHTPKRRLWPSVMVLTDTDKKPLAQGHIVDLAKQNEEAADANARIVDCKPFGYGGIDPSQYEVTGAAARQRSRWSLKALFS
ncbi:HD-GYP domain-containing protein [Vreelandella utahensis]|uniref:HD-GYP domain-containing protein n=1 Tax=Vreelandella halophila TaxID=86177 RepID=UPI00098515C9|nr:HD-GYP domain-containing protein [Halomonas utahensis]